jgi:hypothetical protein
VCNQSVGLVQRVLDEEGISTISLTLSASITRRIKPSRALLVEHPFGLPMGDLHDDATHDAVLEEMLAGAERIERAGTMEALPFEWTKDDLRSRQLRKEAH